MRTIKIDKTFLFLTLLLVLGGLLIFSSAALGLLAGEGAKYSSVAFNHIFLGILLGLVALIFTAKKDYKSWKKYSFYFFIFSLLLTFAVFIPGVGFSHGGAKRWIEIGSFSFQPAEFLKLGFVFYLAGWLSAVKDKVTTIRYGILPFLILTGLVGVALLMQPDTDTFMVIFFAGISMLFMSGAKLRHIFGLALISIAAIAVLAFARPYVMERITTFMHPERDPQGSGYQIQQSLIAIGSGKVFGRGFGQSIQKFNFLPEPIGDSIFAVAAEEFGFVGAVTLVLLFLAFAIRGLQIAIRAPDSFSGLLVVGIVILIVSQSFLNMGAMLGLLPLSGLPLSFISHGGTAMLTSLAAVGVVLNISKHKRSS